MFFLWLQFIVCSLAIVASGTMLSRYGDVIAEKTGLGRAFTVTDLLKQQVWEGVLLEQFLLQ